MRRRWGYYKQPQRQNARQMLLVISVMLLCRREYTYDMINISHEGSLYFDI